METETKHWVRGACIGRGANGTVNLALNISDGSVFAVKSVNSRACLPSQLKSLENEIEILKSISSPFVVKYLGHDMTGSHTNLHMEYLPGGTAADLAGETESVPSYTWCLLSGLSYIHSKGIVHCDVKGRNVLLGLGTAKLADFGSAVEGSVPRGQTRGSPLWMAPEVIRGEYQGPESDVWSLGCTVIEMMTGKPPVWGGEAEAIRRIGWSEERPEFPVEMSSLGCDFLEKCFRRDFRERWSCDQLLRHPFVSLCARKEPVNGLSPRCVLDGVCLNYDDVDSDVEDMGSNLNLRPESNSRVEERIRGLVSGARPNWEFSDEWVVVRGGEEAVRSGYFDLGGADEEIQEVTSDEFSFESDSRFSSFSLSGGQYYSHETAERLYNSDVLWSPEGKMYHTDNNEFLFSSRLCLIILTTLAMLKGQTRTLIGIYNNNFYFDYGNGWNPEGIRDIGSVFPLKFKNHLSIFNTFGNLNKVCRIKILNCLKFRYL